MIFPLNPNKGDTYIYAGTTYFFDGITWVTGFAKQTDTTFVISAPTAPSTQTVGDVWLKLSDFTVHSSDGTSFRALGEAFVSGTPPTTPDPEPPVEPDPEPPVEPEFLEIVAPTVYAGQGVVTFDVWFDRANNIRLSDVNDGMDPTNQIRPPSIGRFNIGGSWSTDGDTLTFTAADSPDFTVEQAFSAGNNIRWRMGLLPSVEGRTTSDTATFQTTVV